MGTSDRPEPDRNELLARLAAAEARVAAAEQRLVEQEQERRQAEEAARLARRAQLPPTPIGRPLTDLGEQRLLAHIREQLAEVTPLSVAGLDKLRRFEELFEHNVSCMTVQPGDYEAASQWRELHALFRELSVVLFERLHEAGERAGKAPSREEAAQAAAAVLGLGG